MTESNISSIQTQFSPIVQNSENKDYFHGLVASALFRIDSEKVTIDNIHTDPNINDQILGSLLSKNLIIINPDESLSLTQAGLQAIDKKIAIVYPIGPNSSVKGYNDTLRNMTDNGLKAFILALSSEISILKKVPKVILTNLFSAMVKNNIFNKISDQVIDDINRTCNDIVYTTRVASKASDSVSTYINEIEIIESKIRMIFKAKIREIGSVTLKKHVNFENKGVITHIVVDESQDDVSFNVTDPYGDVYQYSLEETSVSIINELSNVMNI